MAKEQTVVQFKVNGEVVIRLTWADVRVDTFRAGGKGGQNQNKVESGVRVTHEPSGAVGEGRDTRDQLKNKRAAVERMVLSPQFKAWVSSEMIRLIGRDPFAPKARGTAHKGEKIRTYHKERGLVTDHRTHRHYPYSEVIDGKGIDEIIEDNKDNKLFFGGQKR